MLLNPIERLNRRKRQNFLSYFSHQDIAWLEENPQKDRINLIRTFVEMRFVISHRVTLESTYTIINKRK